MRRPSAALLLLACAGCTWFSQDETVLITSDPPGAAVLVDGLDLQRTTPVSLAIGGSFGTDHWITLRKRGYRDEHRLLTQFTEGYTSRWIDGAGDLSLPPLPIFWTAGDFFLPFGVRSAVVPNELYVKLYREDEPLLGFDVLRARAAAKAAEVRATR